MLAFKAKRYSEAEAICQGKQLRTKLSALRSGDFPLAPEENSILDVRLAHRDEAALYKQAAAGSRRGKLLLTLTDAAAYILKLPKEPRGVQPA